MVNKRIILLAGEWDTTPIVYNFLKEHLSVYKVVIEEGVSKKQFLKKRIKKLGWFPVLGQVLFQVLIGKPLKKYSAQRISQIIKAFALSKDSIERQEVIRVPSANSDECLKILQGLNPDIIVVHGTRIISKKILKGVKCPFINIHAGITPRYRGSHGAYWALANNDEANCGVTVHLIDEGIDTGNILFQKRIEVTTADNFITYGYLQLAEGLRLLEKAIKLIDAGTLRPEANTLDSALWHHPTLWGYLYKRLTKGIK